MQKISQNLRYELNRKMSENTYACPLPQTMRHSSADSAATSPKAEYERGPWRYRSLSPLRIANAGIPIGVVPFRLLPLSLPNSNHWSGNCSSRQGCIPRQRSCAPGASKTGMGSMSRNADSNTEVCHGPSRADAFERRPSPGDPFCEVAGVIAAQVVAI